MADCLAVGDRPRVVGVIKAGVRPFDPTALTDMEAIRAAVGSIFPGEFISLGEPQPLSLELFEGIVRPATVRMRDYDWNTHLMARRASHQSFC